MDDDDDNDGILDDHDDDDDGDGILDNDEDDDGDGIENDGNFKLREGFKNPSYGKCPWWGGGVPPFSVNFLASRFPWWGGRGYPPLPL